MKLRKSFPRGVISAPEVWHTISCGGGAIARELLGDERYKCKVRVDCRGSRLKDKIELWKKLGWVYTAEYGWLCMTCAKAYNQKERK